MDEQQYEELEDLVQIFESGCLSSDGENYEEVQCFDLIKEIVDNGDDTKNIPKKVKEKMQRQMIDAFEWIESLNAKAEYKDKFLSYFYSDNE